VLLGFELLSYLFSKFIWGGKKKGSEEWGDDGEKEKSLSSERWDVEVPKLLRVKRE
jgi:hypothetical protein